MKNKKIYYSVLIVLLLILVLSTTYAFFAPHAGGTTSSNATVTSNTTDLLTFSINRDISFTVTQALFAENGENQSGDATATATLTPNNKTGAATMNYYLYLNIESNPTVYSEANTNEDPELMLQVFDGNNQLVTLTGLGTQKTIKGVTGYDITGVSGLKTLLDNHAISATNNIAAIENWRIVITLINLDVNQNDNTGKTIEAEIIIRKNELLYPYTGVLYTKSAELAEVGSSIIPSLKYNWCDVEISSGITGDCFDTLEECNNFLVEEDYTETHRCDRTEGETVGLSSYVKNVNDIKHSAYGIYCETDQSGWCSNSYLTLDECENNKRENYVCKLEPLFIPIYIKHEVNDDIVESTNICIHHNSQELCFDGSEWVENDDSNFSLTISYIEDKIGNVLRSNDYYSYCTKQNYGIDCSISEILIITLYFNGDISIKLPSLNYGCELYNDGTSSCNLPNNTLDLSNKYLILKDFSGKEYAHDMEDDIIGIYPDLIPTNNYNNISSYLNNNYELFMLWDQAYGYDLCFYKDGKIACEKRLLDGTPGLSNTEQMLSMVKNKLETIFEREVRYYNYSDHSRIEIPDGTFVNGATGGMEISFGYEENEIRGGLDGGRIEINNNQEWIMAYSHANCWLNSTVAGCYWE